MADGEGAVNRSTTDAHRARIAAIYAAFFTNGLIFASWVARLPAVRTRLGASEPELGGALLAIAAGAVVAMPLTSRLCDRFGLRHVLTAAMVACTSMLVVATLRRRTSSCSAAALLGVGFAYGTWDVSMNAAAHDVEVAVDRPLMPRFHGALSVGGLCGAGLGALAAALGLAVAGHLAVARTAVVVDGTGRPLTFPIALPRRATLPAERRRGG